MILQLGYGAFDFDTPYLWSVLNTLWAGTSIGLRRTCSVGLSEQPSCIAFFIIIPISHISLFLAAQYNRIIISLIFCLPYQTQFKCINSVNFVSDKTSSTIYSQTTLTELIVLFEHRFVVQLCIECNQKIYKKINSKSIAVGAQCQLSFEVDEGVFEVVVVGIVLAPN